VLKAELSPLARVLLWDFGRDTLPYDLALVVVFVIILLAPGGWWGDPLWLVD
jgi:hypothetical protein